MPEVAESKEVLAAKTELEKLDKKIADVKRRKLITVVSSGGSDAVLYVEPLDLGDVDPEGDVPEVENYVIENDFTQGFSNPKTARRFTGRMLKRGPRGPFGWTHKIDTTTQDGVRGWEELKRTIETHSSRFTKVPVPLPYHHEVDSNGYTDLRNIHIVPADVPVAELENYKPLEDLQVKREKLIEKLKSLGVSIGVEPRQTEESLVAENKGKFFSCPAVGCGFVTTHAISLAMHKGKIHKD